jgi:hypothetical protein
VELRQGTARDASEIRELTLEAYAKWMPVIGREPKPMTADYALALREHRFDLLYVEGKLAALIETIKEADQPYRLRLNRHSRKWGYFSGSCASRAPAKGWRET